ncbi:MAG: PrsW family glutamic-type intramembrane protease [Bacteroidales bacterium]|jgi:RsiW-degrading membrane proteinase PrsW (M82 family)
MLFTIAIAPVLIILFYIYFSDKYEREPIRLVIKGFLGGVFIIIPVIFVEQFLGLLNIFEGSKIISAFYDAFVVAGFSEELFKFLATVILFWRSKEFNEKFDGIVYAVSVSLGFACVENIMYVFAENSLNVGLLRAVTAVPAHAIFGVTMGYYLGLAKFKKDGKQSRYSSLAFVVPWMLHGLYDFFLMTGYNFMLLLFIPYVIYLYRVGFRYVRKHRSKSPFNPNNMKFLDEDSSDNNDDLNKA